MSVNPDSLPTPQDPTGPCPRCGRHSNFAVELDKHALVSDLEPTIRIQMSVQQVSVLRCAGCHKATVVITDTTRGGIHWYPSPGMGTLDDQVNAGVASAYDEGMRCLGIGANRAAAIMFRSALHLFVKDKGDAEAANERHLKSALGKMKQSGHLHPSLWDWAAHLNQLGNEGAHPEDYDDVTENEAKALGDFVRQLIAFEYEMPAKLLRSQGLLPKSTAAGTSPTTPRRRGPGASSVSH